MDLLYIFPLQVLFHLLVVCLTSGYQIEKHYTVIHYLYMIAEEGTVTAYSQTVDKFVIHQFLAVRQFLDVSGIDNFLYCLTH